MQMSINKLLRDYCSSECKPVVVKMPKNEYDQDSDDDEEEKQIDEDPRASQVQRRSDSKIACELQDIFPVLLKQKETVYSIVMNYTSMGNDADHAGLLSYENEVPAQLIELSCFSGIVRLRFMNKIGEDQYQSYFSNYRHFDFNDLVRSIQEESSKKQIEDREQEKGGFTLCENRLTIVYTPRYADTNQEQEELIDYYMMEAFEGISKL